MKILALCALIAIIFGIGFCSGVIYTAYVGSTEEEPLNVQLANNLESVGIEFWNISYEFDGNPLDYNLTGDPEKDNMLQLRFCNLTVIDESPIYVVIVTELLVQRPYYILCWDKYDLRVVFRDYNAQRSELGRDGLYFYAFYNLYLVE